MDLKGTLGQRPTKAVNVSVEFQAIAFFSNVYINYTLASITVFISMHFKSYGMGSYRESSL